MPRYVFPLRNSCPLSTLSPRVCCGSGSEAIATTGKHTHSKTIHSRMR